MKKTGASIPVKWVERRFCRGDEFWGVCWFETVSRLSTTAGRCNHIHAFR